ncbi:MAG: DUF3267 domain-containing protein [Prolixibacteraceae bacterium]|nr:DUF3267 domain-containing protein [Prolixibacteraceae bacterium]
MRNPSIHELRESADYKLIGKLSHNEIKEFVMHRISEGGKLVFSYMIYQIAMILFGMFFFTRSIILAFNGNFEPLFFSLAALVFCFTFLIIIHELLHALALKFTGAKKINIGGYLKKFIFYAEADKHVLNRKQFSFVALTPLFVVKIVTLIGIVLFFHHPAAYFFIFLMSAHSLFCAGDIGLLTLFYHEKNAEIFTFDVKAEKTSYYYQKL